MRPLRHRELPDDPEPTNKGDQQGDRGDELVEGQHHGVLTAHGHQGRLIAGKVADLSLFTFHLSLIPKFLVTNLSENCYSFTENLQRGMDFAFHTPTK